MSPSLATLFGFALVLARASAQSIYSAPIEKPICVLPPASIRVNSIMYGYSLAMSQLGEGPDLASGVLAVGNPWAAVLGSVDVYKRNATSWTKFATVIDEDPLATKIYTNNNRNYTGYPHTGLKLFGYSTSLSANGRLLAVGIPGRSDDIDPAAIPVRDWLARQSYHGAVRLYYYINGTYQKFTSSDILIPAPNRKEFYDRFGSKVVLSSSGKTLFVAANAGWDGFNMYDFSTTFSDPSFNTVFRANRTTNTQNLGIFVFNVNTPNATSFAGGNVTFAQFLKSNSPFPFGTQGFDFALHPNDDGLLAVRDFYQSGAADAPGAVTLWRRNQTSGVWAVDSVLRRPTAGDTFSNTADDWFGKSIAFARTETGTDMLYASSPRIPRAPIQIFSADAQTKSLRSSSTAVNPRGSRDSSFGSASIATPDGRFLFVADPTSGGGIGVGGNADNGRGTVYIYNLRNSSEIVTGYERSPRLGGHNATIYDQIGAFVRTTDTEFWSGVAKEAFAKQDQFGAAMALGAGNKLFAVAAPVEGCVYTFSIPTAEYVPPPPIVNEPPPQDNNTIVPNPNDRPAIPPEDIRASNSNGVIIGVVAGVGSVLAAAPLAFFGLKHLHKQRTLAKLAAQAAAGGPAQ